ncbi:MAG: hypothetical protein ACW99U_22005 [Candidatus Thorarchaeota archaeon]|jgi:hypothetical protein
MKKFTNTSKEVFNAVWAGQTTVLKPGDAIKTEDNIAKKFAKDLAYSTLLKERAVAEKQLRDEGKPIKVVAVLKTELKKKMTEFLEDIGEESMIERAEATPAKKKATKKEVKETPSDEEFA